MHLEKKSPTQAKCLSFSGYSGGSPVGRQRPNFMLYLLVYNLNYYIYLDNVRSTLSYLYDSTSLKLRFLKEKF